MPSPLIMEHLIERQEGVKAMLILVELGTLEGRRARPQHFTIRPDEPTAPRASQLNTNPLAGNWTGSKCHLTR